MRRFAFAVGLLATLIIASACGGGSDEDDAAPTPEDTPSTNELAGSVVLIVALDEDRNPIWNGSGTVIDSDGLILTNGHVVDDRFDEYDVLAVAVTEEADEPPKLEYIAEIAAVDYVLDLAVIELATDLNGDSVRVDLPAVRIGDSDDVEIGDEISILGYPGIGGETITFTKGAVSGFTAEREISGRSWIKTDATISGGNSGGLAADSDGRLIGVPTIVGSGSDAAAFVDCRLVVDTNRDGRIDENDSCTPVGGFINGLRPVELALPLIEAVENGEEYVSRFGDDLDFDFGEGEDIDTAGVLFSALLFGNGVDANDQPTNVVPSLESGAAELCAFWDYEGMENGMTWEALWLTNGDLDEDGSILDETWVGDEEGSWWVCIRNAGGLVDGLNELVLSVEGDVQASDAIYVGGDHPLVEFTVENDSDSDIVCLAQLSPSEAENWGENELDPGEVLEPGSSRTFSVAAGEYDLRLLDCDAETLAEEYELDAADGGSFTLN